MKKITTLLIDLDDTLYPQSHFLDGAWNAVASASTLFGAQRDEFAATLRAISALGSAQGRIINRALAESDCAHLNAAPLIAAFSAHLPTELPTYANVESTLRSLRGDYALALVTDGIPAQQRAKLAALGLTNHFDIVVCSDDAGRAFRKPHARPFTTALEHLGATPDCAVMIGDSPHKDIAGAHAIGMRSIRVRTGEYASISDDATVSIDRFCDVSGALRHLNRE